jgi:hypothetical protein
MELLADYNKKKDTLATYWCLKKWNFQKKKSN